MLVVEVGTITFTSGDGTEVVSLSKFSASEPLKAILFFATFQGTTTGVSSRDTHDMIGMSDGVTEGCVHAIAPDNIGTSNTSRTHVARACAFYNSSKSVLGVASVTDLQDDEFEMTYSSVTGGGWKVQFVALGGSSLTDAEVVNWDEQEDDEGSPKTVTVGFQPHAIINFSSGLLGTGISTTPLQADDARTCIGFTVGSDKYCIINESSDGATVSLEYVTTADLSAQSRVVTIGSQVTLTPVSGGFEVSIASEGNTSSSSYQHTALCLRGSEIQFEEVSSPTATGDQDFTFTDRLVRGAIVIGSGLAKGSSIAQNRLAIGAYDGTDNWAVGHHHTDNETTMDNNSWWFDDTFIRTYFDDSGTIGMDATVSVVSDETLRLTWTNVEATARSFALMIFTDLTAYDCENNLGLTASILLEGLVLDISNTLGLSELIEHNYIYEDCGNEFAFEESAGYHQQGVIIQYLGFTERVPVDATNYIGWTQHIGEVTSAVVENSLGLADTITRAYIITNEINFSSTVIGMRLEDVENTLGLTDVADASGTEYGRDHSQSCIKQHLSFRVSGGPQCLEKEYHPFVGSSGDDSYDAIVTVPPTLGSGTLTLTHPVVSPTSTLVLKNPAFGNTDVIGFSLIDRETRGGDRIIYGDQDWPSTRTLNLQLEHVCETDLADLLEFLNTTLGKEIGLADWEGRDWVGIIATPDTEIVQRVSGYSVAIVFFGDLA